MYVTVGEQYQRRYSVYEASVQSKRENSHLFVGNEGTDGQTRDTAIFLTMIFFLHFVLSHTPSVYQSVRFYSHCLHRCEFQHSSSKPHKIAHFSGGCHSHRWVPVWKHLPLKTIFSGIHHSDPNESRFKPSLCSRSDPFNNICVAMRFIAALNRSHKQHIVSNIQIIHILGYLKKSS